MNLLNTLRGITLLLCLASVAAPRSHAARRFSVIDAIRVAHFGDPYWDSTDPILFSPDGRYFVADIERGVPERNRPESTLRVYRAEAVNLFVRHRDAQIPLSPYLELTRSTYEQGPIITQIRWLDDSSGIVFLVKSSSGLDQLFLADLRSRRISVLTPSGQSVVDYDVRDRAHYVYTVKSSSIVEGAIRRGHVVGFVGTGYPLRDLIFPVDKYPWLLLDSHKVNYDLKDLWAVVGGRRFRVHRKSSGQPLHLHWTGGFRTLALSPDGSSVVTVMAVDFVPSIWRTLYPPPSPNSPDVANPGPQDVDAVNGVLLGKQYVRIDLNHGTISSLTDAPTGYSEGWRSNEGAAWSSDGKWVALFNSFIPGGARGAANEVNYPCVTMVAIDSGNATCLETLGRGRHPGQESFIKDVKFDRRSSSRVYVQHAFADQTGAIHLYVRVEDGKWVPNSTTDKLERNDSITISIAQSLNDPPVLVARDETTSLTRVIWDPNPQLKNIDLTPASVFTWTDKAGRSWVGGLYLPADYSPAQSYPVVVQTHGFVENEFRPEGIYPTAFAARALAASGIMVLQAPDCQVRFTSQEGACQVDGYESGIEKLVSEGMADPSHIGIIGFSRTCYAVLETLTKSSLHFAAASITDGLNMGYLQYLQYLDDANGFYARDAELANRGQPFGDGLQKWFALSPEFNLQKVFTPLQIVALGADSVLEMWEPYAALRFLRRPVDLIVLGDGTHNLSNPQQRLVSQQGTVDWFRFWLQDYEDPDPVKIPQYARWQQLRGLEHTSP